ncbi:hypothetical protein [Nostoc sp. LEGE 12447]|uniref:hypothetical protein n=1 Tax=Nostoc sp. LEGE 12447 TaxID=1828640 RepID=UPI002AD485B4|nr:hypothetical protein [Nostoc sp. LEGE 12447]
MDVPRRRYLYHQAEADLLAGTVMLLVVSLLLVIVKPCDPPFKIAAESSVELVLDNAE